MQSNYKVTKMNFSYPPSVINENKRARGQPSAYMQSPVPPSLPVHNAHVVRRIRVPFACIYAPRRAHSSWRKDTSLSTTCAAKYVRLNNKSPDSRTRQRPDCRGIKMLFGNGRVCLTISRFSCRATIFEAADSD